MLSIVPVATKGIAPFVFPKENMDVGSGGPGRQVTAVGGFKNDPQDTIGFPTKAHDANRSRNVGSGGRPDLERLARLLNRSIATFRIAL
jgi:hypothetical protein